MRRCVIGFAMLVGLFLGSLLCTEYMIRQHEPLSEALTQAAAAALEGDLDRGAAICGKAREEWAKNRNFGAVLADHEPMEEIDGDFVQLEAYAAAGWEVEFAVLCGELSHKLQAMGDAHGLDWWNFL